MNILDCFQGLIVRPRSANDGRTGMAFAPVRPAFALKHAGDNGNNYGNTGEPFALFALFAPTSRLDTNGANS